MNWKSHVKYTLFIAVLLILALAYFQNIFFPPERAILWIIVAGIASLLPDVDLEHSKISMTLIPIVVMCVAGFWIYIFKFETFHGIPFFFIPSFISLFVIHKIYKTLTKGHRGWTHGLVFAVTIALPFMVWFDIFIASAPFFGIICHIIEDKFCDITRVGAG